MTLKEIIDGLNELILDRESFIEKDDPDSISFTTQRSCGRRSKSCKR